MMSQCMVPNWKLRHQRQEQVGGEEGNRSSHKNSQLQNHSRLVPMSSNYEVAELTWENGQLAMHELGGLLPTGAPTKQQTWGTMGTSDNTLESIVHQATTISQQQKQNQNIGPQQHGRNNIPAAENNPSSTVASSAGKWAKPSGLLKKRMRSESDQSGRYNNNNNIIIIQEEFADRSASASASATVCRDNDTTAMTWASFESPRSLKTKATDEDSACHDDSENLDEERETKGELTGRSHLTRRSRAAAVHNQSERRRRDRINQKMKTLQKLVPNASKSDKASMLDEVIDYLKQLQAQLRMMMMSNNARSIHMPQMMMPMGIQAQQQQQQQQIQMSMQLARMAMGVGPGSIPMGMGIGLGTGIPQSLPQLIHHPPPFVVPPMIPNHTPQPQPTTHQDAAAAISNSFPFNHPYYAFLAQQSMNMDLCNKMAEIYRQQVSQSTTPPRSNPSPSSHAQRG